MGGGGGGRQLMRRQWGWGVKNEFYAGVMLRCRCCYILTMIMLLCC